MKKKVYIKTVLLIIAIMLAIPLIWPQSSQAKSHDGEILYYEDFEDEVLDKWNIANKGQVPIGIVEDAGQGNVLLIEAKTSHNYIRKLESTPVTIPTDVTSMNVSFKYKVEGTSLGNITFYVYEYTDDESDFVSTTVLETKTSNSGWVEFNGTVRRKTNYPKIVFRINALATVKVPFYVDDIVINIPCNTHTYDSYIETSDPVDEKYTRCKVCRINMIDKIELIDTPSKTCELGEEIEVLDIENVRIKVTRIDGTSYIITKGYTVSGFDSSKVGVCPLVFSYMGKKCKFELDIVPCIHTYDEYDESAGLTEGTYAYCKKCNEYLISSIELLDKPSKTTYEVGDKFDESDVNECQIKVARIDGTSFVITKGYTVSGFDSSKVGVCPLVFSYLKSECKFGLDIVPCTHIYDEYDESTGLTEGTYAYCKKCNEYLISSIELLDKPSKTTYEVNEAIDYSDFEGYRIKVRRIDGTSYVITKGYTVSGFNSSKVGVCSLVFSYMGKECTFEVNVAPCSHTYYEQDLIYYNGIYLTGQAAYCKKCHEYLVNSVELLDKPSKTVYEVGEEFDESDIYELKVTRIDGSSYISRPYLISGFDSSKAGICSLVFSYINEECTFDVSVVPHTHTYDEYDESKGLTEGTYAYCKKCNEYLISSIELLDKPSKTVYEVGEKIDYSDFEGYRIKVRRIDGTNYVITKGYTVSGFDSSKEGTTSLKFDYGGRTTNFKITIVDPNNIPVTVNDVRQKINTNQQQKLSFSASCWVEYEIYKDGNLIDAGKANLYGDTKTKWSFKMSDWGVGKYVMLCERYRIEKVMSSGRDPQGNYSYYYSYEKGDYIGTTYIDIEVEKVLTDIRLVKQPDKLVYYVGEDISNLGLAVRAKFDDGSEQDITDLCEITGYNSLETGRQLIKLAYKDKETYFSVQVKGPKDLGDVEVTLVSYKSIKLIWEKTEGANAYQVYYKKASDKTYSYLGMVDELEYQKNNLNSGAEYSFKVVPIYQSNDQVIAQGKESIVYITTPNVKSITGLKAELASNNSVELIWEKTEGANAYQVYYKKTNGSIYNYLGDVNELMYKVNNLSTGTEYNFKVVPVYKINGQIIMQGNDSVVCIKTLQEKDTTITYTVKKLNRPKVKKVSSKKIKISWNNIEGETGYQISQSAKKGKTKIVTTYKTTKGKSKKISAPKGKKLYYKVRAYTIVNGKIIYGKWSKVVAYKLK